MGSMSADDFFKSHGGGPSDPHAEGVPCPDCGGHHSWMKKADVSSAEDREKIAFICGQVIGLVTAIRQGDARAIQTLLSGMDKSDTLNTLLQAVSWLSQITDVLLAVNPPAPEGEPIRDPDKYWARLGMALQSGEYFDIGEGLL